MQSKPNTIGLEALLDEIDRDLEREWLLVRHVPSSVVRLRRRMASLKVLMAGFFAGWLAMIAVQTAVSLLFS